jgi:RNA polymerase sigma-70 factor, ECF subfamily
MMPDPLPVRHELKDRLQRQDESALAELFSGQRDRLLRMVDFRMDERLRTRIWPDDVLQEAYIAASQRINRFAEDGFESPFIWLRMVVHQTLIDLHRRHLGAQMRDAGKEVSLDNKRFSQTTSASMAIQLVGDWTTPTQAAVRSERYEAVKRTIEQMAPMDREILALRHFEELTNGEAAEELGIQPKAASIRYVRALARLRQILSESPGLLEEDTP